jgi:hypothetical protein
LRNVAGYRRRDEIRNTKIRDELNIFNLNNKILKSGSSWKHHVLRMENRRIPKKILKYNPKMRRNIGRLLSKWRDQHALKEAETDQASPNP